MVLKGIKVIEMMGLAPGPFCGTILADFGASVIVIQKLEPPPLDVMSNGKRVISINLKTSDGLEIVKKLSAKSDILLDTYRPGVMEKLGLGPEDLMKKNPHLIYARLSGYGQQGAFKNVAGHDLNYLAMSGILSRLVRNKEPPYAPLNIIGDFAAGSLLCSFGIVLALFERCQSGKGQIVDASMTEGAAYISSWIFKSRKYLFNDEPGTNLLDGGAHFYQTYKTKDGKFMAVAAIEPQFYSNLLKGLQLSEEDYTQTTNNEHFRKKFSEIFLSKTQDEWCAIFETLDACVTPILNFDNVDSHKCNSSRKTFYKNTDNVIVPEPAPKFSRTPGFSSGRQHLPKPGEHSIEILTELGYESNDIKKLIKSGCICVNNKSNL